MIRNIEQGFADSDNILALLLCQREIVRKIEEIRQSKDYFLMNRRLLQEENTLLKARLALVEKMLRAGQTKNYPGRRRNA